MLDTKPRQRNIWWGFFRAILAKQVRSATISPDIFLGGYRMNRILTLTLCTVLLVISTAAWASLDSFMANLNVQARADLPGFKAGISAQFGVPLPQVEMVFAQVAAPADVFMTFQLGQMANKPAPVVLQSYQSNKGKGWGVIARELGIKPGSAAFHALKNGNLRYTGQPGGGYEDSPGKGKGKGKGHNK